MSFQTTGSNSIASSVRTSLHGNILKESTENVFDKYEILQVLGQGSMGYVAKVKVRSGRVGGSATNPKKKKGPFGLGIVGKFRNRALQNPTAIAETSDHVYAIKTIILEKVSPMFVQELENEVRGHLRCAKKTMDPSISICLTLSHSKCLPFFRRRRQY